jgi:hypothetical protein
MAEACHLETNCRDRGTSRQRLKHAGIGIERLVGDHRIGLHCWQQMVGPLQVVCLAAGQEESERVAQRVDQSVDLGAQSAARASDRLVLTSFSWAPALCWWARTMVPSIHRIFVVGVRGEMLKHPLPHTAFGPTAEPQMDLCSAAEPLRQITPRHPGTITIQQRECPHCRTGIMMVFGCVARPESCVLVPNTHHEPESGSPQREAEPSEASECGRLGHVRHCDPNARPNRSDPGPVDSPPASLPSQMLPAYWPQRLERPHFDTSRGH